MEKFYFIIALFAVAFFTQSCGDDSTSSPEESVIYQVEYHNYRTFAETIDLLDQKITFIESLLPDILNYTALYSSKYLNSSYSSPDRMSYKGINNVQMKSYCMQNSRIHQYSIPKSKTAEFESKLNTYFTSIGASISQLDSALFPKSELNNNHQDLIILDYHCRVTTNSVVIKNAEYKVMLPVIKGTKWVSSNNPTQYVEFINDSLCNMNVNGTLENCKYNRRHSFETEIFIDKSKLQFFFNYYRETNKAILKNGTDSLHFVKQ